MLALEYLAKLFIYLIVVIVIVGLMVNFFMGKKICLFNCKEEKETCDIKTLVVDEGEITSEIIDKYCYLCWKKNNFGNCKENALCYVVNGNFYAFQYYPLSDPEHCEITCGKDSTSIPVSYTHLTLPTKA